MNGLLSLLLLGFSSWNLVVLCQRLRMQKVSAHWWVVLGLLIACGMGLGSWCAFCWEYQLGTQFRFGSFPIPVVVFQLEADNWVDFPIAGWQMWPVMISNVISITAFATLPLWLVRNRKAP